LQRVDDKLRHYAAISTQSLMTLNTVTHKSRQIRIVLWRFDESLVQCKAVALRIEGSQAVGEKK